MFKKYFQRSSAKGTTVKPVAVALPLVNHTYKVFLISSLDYRIFPISFHDGEIKSILPAMFLEKACSGGKLSQIHFHCYCWKMFHCFGFGYMCPWTFNLGMFLVFFSELSLQLFVESFQDG